MQIDPADIKGWNIIYPAYINSNKTLKNGRKLGKEHCIANPTLDEISQVLTFLKLRHCVEPHKRYTRDQLSWGRVKVMMFGEDCQAQN